MNFNTADRKEFIKISQAVGVGFLVMGAVGFVVKLSRSSFSHSTERTSANFTTVHIPLNNVLVGAA
jgi:protein transport protein SEC61 subunit gamma-like protein